MFLFGKKKIKFLKAYLSGKVIPVTEVEDEVFSSKMMGDGIAIHPTSNVVVAPSDGIVTMVMLPSKHAVALKLNNDMEVLIHVGIDTVSMAGEGFEVFVKEGEKVKLGDPLIKFDEKLISESGFSNVTMMIVTNSDEFVNLNFSVGIDAIEKETIIANF